MSVLVLDSPLKQIPRTGTAIFRIQAVTYARGENGFTRDENRGGGALRLSENIENVQFEYFDGDGNETDIPGSIRMIKVTATARTSVSDPDYKGGEGGFRRRQLWTNIQIRNMGLVP